jgi:hypothetical protein
MEKTNKTDLFQGGFDEKPTSLPGFRRSCMQADVFAISISRVGCR